MEIAERLERELERALLRLRQTESVLVEEMDAVGSDGTESADIFDGVGPALDREIGFATRSLLRERASRLAAALERVRQGDYGTCEECGEAIAPARLLALPEVTTCVRCQDRREREEAWRREERLLADEVEP